MSEMHYRGRLGFSGVSELTPCNYCSLKRIESRAGPGVEVTTKPGTGDWDGWIVVRRSDEVEPVAFFKALTDRCVC